MTDLRRLLCALTLAGLAACGSEETPPDTAPEATPVEAPVVTEADEAKQGPSIAPAPHEVALPESYALNASWTGDLDVMEQRRIIRVLTVYSVGRYYVDGAEEKGLVRETAQRFENFINKRMGRRHVKVHVVIIPVARNQLIPALLEGRGDIIDASLSITSEREQVLDFSKPISKPLSEILVTGPSAPPLNSIDDLSGQTIYVRRSSSYRESVEALNARFRIERREPVKIQPVSELLEDDDLVEMVNAGMLPWAIIDDYKMQLWEDVFTKLKVRDDIVFRKGGRIAWAFRKGSPKLAAAVNEFMKTHRAGTLIGNVMINRYIRDFDWAANALARDDYSRFEQLEHIFMKYGENYGIDYLMAAAQGYQESRLDQSARSKAGAIGVMQLLPSTARDRNVDIHNIHEVDANIHAGIKYLNFLREYYFSDPAIDDTNRTLLALAAYNVGPGRMGELRERAERDGYNPNVWFDNVELVAARQVGREPVQYVANIYKYYLAYRFSAGPVQQRRAARVRAGIE